MNLTYRGIQYQPRATHRMTIPTKRIGIYRGAKFQLREMENPPTQVGFSILSYRGKTYRSPRYL